MAANAIQCTFNRGCSAAKFIMSPNEGTRRKPPPQLSEELGGVWGGGTILACLPQLRRAKAERRKAFMGIFADQKAIERLAARLQTLEDGVSELKRQSRSAELEYVELYDKVKRQMSRMAKRYAVDQKENGELVPDETETDPYNHLDPISRSIMIRRGRPEHKS